MKLDLIEKCRRVEDIIASLDANTQQLMRQAYWYGVTSGVTVFCKSLNGDYR